MGTRERYEHGVFSWVDVMAHDMRRASEFYGTLFGWKVVDQDTHGGPPYAMLELDGKAVAGLGECSEEMKQAGVPAAWNTYVTVDDADAAAAKVEEAGGKLDMPVMDVFDVGRMTFLRDPEGTRIAIWQARRHAGCEVVNEPNAFCWSELNTRDPAQAKRFYGALFGWEYAPMDFPGSGYDLVKVGGRPVGGILTMTKEWGDMPSSWTVYFNVGDIGAAVKRVEAGGGRVLKPVFDTPVGPVAVIADPDGACFSLVQLKEHGD